MTFRTEKFITRQMMRREPDTLFVFGDNVKGVGMGGQAAQMRGAPNAVGIATKWLPTRDESAYFTDADYDIVRPFIDEQLYRLAKHLNSGGHVVWPEDGIGTGRAQLDRRAPRIFAMILAGRALLEEANLSPDWLQDQARPRLRKRTP